MKKFKDLSENDQSILIAKAIHVIKNSDLGFRSACEIVGYGQDLGLFEKVKFGHQEVYKDKISDGINSG